MSLQFLSQCYVTEFNAFKGGGLSEFIKLKPNLETIS